MINMLGLKVEIIKIVMPIIYIIVGSILFKINKNVIIKATLDTVTNQTLEEAAELAAYFSKARMSSKVAVDYTARKNVKKPSGAKPGMVIYDDYGTVYVTPDEELVYRLMKNR